MPAPRPVPVVRLKDGVTFARLLPAGVRILAVVDAAAQLFVRDMIVTCGNEGHGPLDPHTHGEAVDISVLAFPPMMVDDLLRFVRSRLGPAFYAQYETNTRPSDASLAAIAVINPAATAPHIHIQRAKGTVFPPPDAPHALDAAPSTTSAV